MAQTPRVTLALALAAVLAPGATLAQNLRSDKNPDAAVKAFDPSLLSEVRYEREYSEQRRRLNLVASDNNDDPGYVTLCQYGLLRNQNTICVDISCDGLCDCADNRDECCVGRILALGEECTSPEQTGCIMPPEERCMENEGPQMRTPGTFPKAPEVPAYRVVRSGTCTSHGLIDIFDDETCRCVMNAGYYGTRDQNGNGVLDSEEMYINAIVDDGGSPPGCWPVDPVILDTNPDFTGPPNDEVGDPFPFACINTNTENIETFCSDAFPCFCLVPEYTVVTSGNCVSNGYADIFSDELCRAVMNEGYYNTRDQNANGIIDAQEDYLNAFSNDDATPPGCWPVDPIILDANPGFTGPPDNEVGTPFPFACVNTNADSPVECSETFPCFCLR